jgi:hypothetical protein
MLAAGKARRENESAIAAWRARMKRRDERRAREGWTPEQIARGSRYIHPRSRPSDGKPPGSKFDHEEFATRKAEARAADPEAYERQKREARRKQRAFWDRYLDEKAHRECDQALKGEMPHDDKERLRSIWHWVVMIDQGNRNDQIHLNQASRIFNARHNRIRGVGAAARRAGFAD